MTADPTDDDAAVTAPATRVPVRHRDLGRGTCVGRYVILGRLGQGGMGVVYRAYDPELDRPIALKLLRVADDARWLLREAQALARLQHPNVIAIHDVGTFQGDVFIAMELVEGKSLNAWLKAPRRTRAQILEAFVAAGEGLAAAHLVGLVHRDFKPDNVVVGDDGRVRVLDFGLARSAVGASAPPSSAPTLPSPADADDPTADVAPPSSANVGRASSPRNDSFRALVESLVTPPPASGVGGNSSGNLLALALTQADSVVGTPRYMSPEQHAGETIDARSDQFSFCVALYQALYGEFPFMGPPDAERRDWRIREPPRSASVPRWLRAVLLRGLAHRPDDRFASITDLLGALRADPAAARQRGWRVALAAALVTTLTAAWVSANRQQARVCAGPERELVGVWDAGRRGQVRAAFQKTGLPYADAAIATVERAFDDYSRAWLAMRVDACEATRVRGDQSQELLDLRMACLSDRWTQARTLSDLFASADVGVVEHAAQSVQSLPGIAGCADVAALKAPVPPPRDAKTLERVDALRKELARTRALEVAAKFDEGLVVGKAALAQAEVLAYAPVTAEAQLDVGRLLGGRGDYAESATMLHHAYVNALAGRDDAVAARVATDLVIAIGTRKAHYEEGDRWAEVAEALAGRMQRKDELLGVLYSTRSNLREREGKYDDALADAKRALEIEVRVFGPDDLRVAETYYHLGAVHYFRAEYPLALEAYGRCLEIQARTVGPDHPVLLGARVGIADVYGDSGDHVRALAEYQSALAAIVRVRPEDPDIPMVRNNLGGELQQLDRPKEAFEQYQLAYEDWRKRIGPGQETITALSNMGEAQLAMGEPAGARSYYSRGLEMCAAALGAGHHLCARLLWGVGEALRLEGKLGDAYDDFQRSLAAAEKALGPTHPQLTGPLLGMGRVELARRAPASARAPLERALAILGDQPGEGLTLPDARFTLARALWASGAAADRARATELARKAREDYGAATGASAKRGLIETAAWLNAHP